MTREAVRDIDWEVFRRIYVSDRYGRPGVQPGLNRYISSFLESADGKAVERLRTAVEHLLYGEAPPAERLDDVVSGAYRVEHFGEAVATKLLAVRFPERFLPVFVFSGPHGKAVLMRAPALGLVPPDVGTRGQEAVRANDLLYQRLEPFFPDDPWGMAQFLYWLRDRPAVAPPPVDALRALADELLVDERFVKDAVALLREKRQLVFYGPPGTGKTYIARKLTDYLAPESTRREVVQFHPSYDYEDFVQGFRPETRPDGTLVYGLKPGPLLRLSARARGSGAEHVLLIDEINRGNLPKIMGELLYLLEYRDDEVALMQGEEGERFSLPENLLLIGTMNTADRSIGLIDAALRRRFHFVPLFPDRAPLLGLLRRWLAREKPAMLEVADVVDRLNARLREAVGPHLQVGHSYFMRPDLSWEVLQRVWDFDVMPFLEDQLFGQEEALREYALPRLRQAAGADQEPETGDDADDRAAGVPAPAAVAHPGGGPAAP